MKQHHRKIPICCVACQQQGTPTFQGTLHGALHRPVTFECGLQGLEVSGDVAVSQDFISSNCHRIQLQTVGTSTFLNVQDTVSHEFELHRYSPVLHSIAFRNHDG